MFARSTLAVLAVTVFAAVVCSGAVAAETPRCVEGPRSKCGGLLIPDRPIFERDLTRSDFRGSWLVGARWNKLDLFKSRLTGANLARARVTDSVLGALNPNLRGSSRMRLANSRLLRVRLGGNLRGASLKGARVVAGNLSGANLARADVRGASLRKVNLRDADLTGARLDGADLRGADLRGANLTRASLNHARLRRARLDGAILVGTDLRGAHLQGADLARALILGADLRLAKLIGAKLGFYGDPTARLGPAWARAQGRFRRPIELAGRVCLTKLDPPRRAAVHRRGAPRPRLGAKIESAHDRFRQRLAGPGARPSDPRFRTVANTLDSGCGGGGRRAAALLAAIGRAKVRQLIDGAVAPSAEIRRWLRLVVRRS